MSLPPPQAEGAPPYFKRPFGRQFLFQKWKKTYQWSQLGKIDPKRLTENGVNLKVIWERWQIVYKTICTAINQFKKNRRFHSSCEGSKIRSVAKREAVTKNRYGHSSKYRFHNQSACPHKLGMPLFTNPAVFFIIVKIGEGRVKPMLNKINLKDL